MPMTQQEIEFVNECIKTGIHRFYVWGKWKRVRAAVLNMDKHECQMCKAKGVYRRADTVHHVNYVKKHPELALEVWFDWKGKRKRNLISLCHSCHEEAHGYRKEKFMKEPITEERW